MFSNLKKMVKENKFSSIIFLMPENSEIKFKRKDNKYIVLLTVPSEFEEHEISENDFFKYLENGLKKIAFSGDWKIVKTVKMDTICSFKIERA